ncbi:MAG: tRNA (pseudouridine(54)-N(1))-methyltransferase TrmY [Methanomassiliicoccales archaeon]
MRRFIIVGHKTPTAADFKLDDMAGGAGRLDVLLRCVNSAFFLSHSIRKDVEVYLVLQGPPHPPRTVRFYGPEMRYLNPDERSTGALVRNALLKQSKVEARSSPGVYVRDIGLREVIASLPAECQVVYLKEDGLPLESLVKGEDMAFVLSDHMDLSDAEEAVLKERANGTISLGPTSYHADHCITIVNHRLDML